MDAETETLRKEYVYMAKVTEEAKQFEDMSAWMKKVAKLAVEFSTEENYLINIAYKMIINRHRSSRAAVYSFERNEETKSNNDHRVERVRDYRHKIEEDISKIAKDILTLINDYLVPSARTPESIVLYYKLKGDYHRYLAELKEGQEMEEAFNESFEAYENGMNIARIDLAPTHPVRLGLALNFAVLYDEVLHSPHMAWPIAHQAYDQATADLYSLSKESYYKQSAHIIKHLKTFCDDCLARINDQD